MFANIYRMFIHFVGTSTLTNYFNVQTCRGTAVPSSEEFYLVRFGDIKKKYKTGVLIQFGQKMPFSLTNKDDVRIQKTDIECLKKMMINKMSQFWSQCNGQK